MVKTCSFSILPKDMFLACEVRFIRTVKSKGAQLGST